MLDSLIRKFCRTVKPRSAAVLAGVDCSSSFHGMMLTHLLLNSGARYTTAAALIFMFSESPSTAAVRSSRRTMGRLRHARASAISSARRKCRSCLDAAAVSASGLSLFEIRGITAMRPNAELSRARGRVGS